MYGIFFQAGHMTCLKVFLLVENYEIVTVQPAPFEETPDSVLPCDRQLSSYRMLHKDRTAAVRNDLAEATRRRRRILHVGFA